METRFLFQPNMDNDPADHNAVQDFVQGSIDHLVGDAVTSGRRYAGFATAATGVTTVTVQPGRFYSAGKVYSKAVETTFDFTTTLPVATRRVVSIVVYGIEQDTNATPREFLIDEETGASEARNVALQRQRIATINSAPGIESANPLPPVTDAAVIVVAQVLLGPTGILSVTQATANQLDSVASVADRARRLEAFEAQSRPQIASLGTDLAALKTSSMNTVDKKSIASVLTRLATIEARAGLPAAAVDSDADFFITKAKTNEAAPYDARIEEGLRFPPAATATGTLQIFNALNPAAALSGGLLLPAYTNELRFTSGPRQSDIQLSTYTFEENELVQRTMSRRRIRYGESYETSKLIPDWVVEAQSSGHFGLLQEDELLVLRSADTGEVVWWDWNRTRNMWADRGTEPYWDQVTIPHTINGTQVAQTFLNTNAMWATSIGLTFTGLAAEGNATLAICETVRGAPNLDRVISLTTITRESMLLDVETRVPIIPTFLQGGTRYAIVIFTAANHRLAMTAGSNFTSGTFFYVLDGAYQQADATRDIAFSVYAARFGAARAIIDMQPLQLAGGIVDIDILSGAIEPDSTDLSFEIFVNNAWTPLAYSPTSILNAGGNLPPLVSLRAIFTGTNDMMPALNLADSRVIVSRPKTAFTHRSIVRTLPAPSTQIRVIARLDGFDPADHTAVATIRTGAGHATSVAASSFVDVDQGDGGIERTWLFNLGAAVSSYVIQLAGTTTDLLDPFTISWRKDYAL